MASVRVNPTEFAILGLLAEQSRSGYDIKTAVEEQLSHFWSESYGHIYPMLRRLERRKLVDVKAVKRQRGRPERKVYAITAAGRRALTAWFSEPPAAARPRNELLLRLHLGRHAPKGALLRDVSAYRVQVTETLRQLREVERSVGGEAAQPDTAYWKLTLGFGVRVFAALADWSAAAESELRKAK